MNKKDMLFEEWKEVRESLRYFGNKRFAQLTVFIAVTGVLVSALLQRTDLAALLVIQVSGIVTTLLFLILEISSVRYWKLFVKRGRTVERMLGTPRLIRGRPALKGFKLLFRGTYATYCFYGVVFLFWVSSFMWR